MMATVIWKCQMAKERQCIQKKIGAITTFWVLPKSFSRHRQRHNDSLRLFPLSFPVLRLSGGHSIAARQWIVKHKSTFSANFLLPTIGNKAIVNVLRYMLLSYQFKAAWRFRAYDAGHNNARYTNQHSVGGYLGYKKS